MPRSITRLKLLVSCTSELQAERSLVERIVSDVNRVIEDAHGVTIRVIDWRRDVVPGVGTDPQQVINAQTQEYEIYLGMLGTRFGTPTPRAASGTEDEFNQAYQRFRRDSTSVRLLFYFRTSLPAGTSGIDTEQLQRVQVFRERLRAEAGVLFGEFAAAEEFIQFCRDHLIQLVREQWADGAWRPVPGLERSSAATDLVLQGDSDRTADDDAPTVLDVRVRLDDAFQSAMSALHDLTKWVGANTESDREWTSKLQAASNSRISARDAQALINLKADDFGRRARELRSLRASLRQSTEEFFDHLITLMDLQLDAQQSPISAEETRAGLRKLLAADPIVRAARDTYRGVAGSIAALPEPTRQFRSQKRNLMQQVEQLTVDIGAWLDRSAELRRRFDLEDDNTSPSE